MTAKKTPKKQLKRRSLPADDPIYTRGFCIGMVGRYRSSTKAQRFTKLVAEEIKESSDHQFGKTDG